MPVEQYTPERFEVGTSPSRAVSNPFIKLSSLSIAHLLSAWTGTLGTYFLTFSKCMQLSNSLLSILSRIILIKKYSFYILNLEHKAFSVSGIITPCGWNENKFLVLRLIQQRKSYCIRVSYVDLPKLYGINFRVIID